VTGTHADGPEPEKAEAGSPDGEDPELDEEIEESFPASDPPSHWSGLGGEGPTVGGRNGTAPLRFGKSP
jgi:hypothetical protein